MSKLLFSTIDVTRQAFFRTKNTFAIVNIRPFVPGHVLVVPKKVVPRLQDLSAPEVAELFTSVQTIGRVLQRVYKSDGLTIACQDGQAAGQTVPHVHVHIIPRRFPKSAGGKGDAFSENNDAIYPAIESQERSLHDDLHKEHESQSNVDDGAEESSESHGDLRMDVDDRGLRTVEDMVKEAKWLSGRFKDEGVVSLDSEHLE